MDSMKAAMTSSDEFPVGIVTVESMKAAVASSDEFTGDLLQSQCLLTIILSFD